MCDLTHDTVVLVTDTIPINVDYIGAYAKSQFGDQIELTFFKYPQSAIDAIATEQPDVLALSNYCWNSLLSEEVAKYAKSLRPSTLTVQGGTNFPNDAKLQLEFLKTRQSTDIHVQLEGAIVFQVDQMVEDQVDVLRLAIGRQPHQFVLSAVDAKPGEVRERRIQQTQ